LTPTTNDECPRVPILHKNITRMKLNKDIVIVCKFLNGKKITGNFGNTKNIFKV
jgi:hypothetical protein